MSLADPNVASSRQKVAQIAQGILDGRVGIIAGARQISGLCGGHLGLDERDPDLATFVGIDSETDDLPIGNTRRHWAPDALARKDVEIARCEAVYREPAFEAASHLVARFAHAT
jgi:hypothetical protein